MAREFVYRAFIYKPSRTAMQMGKKGTADWVLELEQQLSPYVEPLMGWRASKESIGQIKMKFSSLDQAVSHARKQNWEFFVMPYHDLSIAPKNYGDNFSFKRVKT